MSSASGAGFSSGAVALLYSASVQVGFAACSYDGSLDPASDVLRLPARRGHDYLEDWNQVVKSISRGDLGPGTDESYLIVLRVWLRTENVIQVCSTVYVSM